MPLCNSHYISLFTIVLISIVQQGCAIRCYQCSSDQQTNKEEDQCGAYATFDTERNSLVECLGEEAHSPGTFCYKSIQQGPRGFIWDGRWRTVTRRCAQLTERGISWGCDWGYKENGVYWEECYCAEDGCNSAPHFKTTFIFIAPLLLGVALIVKYFATL